MTVEQVRSAHADPAADAGRSREVTLSVVSWAEQAHTLAIARTVGVVVFSMFNLFFSLESRDRRDSVFSLSTFADRTCIVTTEASLFLLVMATVLAPCQAILKTTALDVDQ